MSRTIQFASLAALTYSYVLLTPYTKVEESFGIQAVHDFIYLGLPRALDITNKLANGSTDWYIGSNFPLDFKFTSEPVNIVHSNNYTGWHWDHEEFPGPLPRTFIGPFILSLFTFPWSLYQRTPDKIFIQIFVRMTLSSLILFGFFSYCSAVTRKFGRHTTSVLTILAVSQFHFLFYASRTLPNIFALVLVLFASAKWLSGRNTPFIILVAITVVIFRAETALLFGPMIINSLFIQKNLGFSKLFLVGIPAGLISLFSTVLFDSYMWQKWVWPEAYGIFFNVYLNKSADWGVQPFLWYFYSALPRSLLCSVFFVPFASERCIRSCFFVSIMFIFLYSFLGHKELRFIIYCLPLLNTCAANSIAITGYRFFTFKPYPESWIVHIVLKRLGYIKPNESDEQKKKSEKKKAEKKKHSKKSKSKLPDQYDALPSYQPVSAPVDPSVPSTSTPTVRRRRGLQNIIYYDEVLDEQYSKITAAVFEVNQKDSSKESLTPPTPKARVSLDDLPPSAAYFTTIVLAIMAFHVFVNIGCLVYAYVASWHNYPGGDAINWTNQHILNKDLKMMQPSDIGVYVSNYAAQTGFTRFLQLDGVTYDKSPDYFVMINKTERIAKWRSPYNLVASPSVYGKDFKAIYFILEKIDVKFITKFCSATRVPRKSSSSSVQSTDPIDSVICKLGSDVQDCTLVKSINAFDRIDLKSIFVLTAPKLWIFRCHIH